MNLKRDAITFLAARGVCWGEFRLKDFEIIFNFKNTSPARIFQVAQHISDLHEQGYQTFVIVFIEELDKAPSILSQDEDYEISYKSSALEIIGDCYIHNITKGIFMIEANYTPDKLYEMYKLSINGLNNFAHHHKNRCFDKTHWFKNYLNGNVFLEMWEQDYDIKNQIKSQNKNIEKLQTEMLQKHYLEAGFSYEDLLHFLRQKQKQIKSNS